MDSTLIAALITVGGSILTTLIVIMVKRRKKKPSGKVSFEHSAIEYKNEIRSISKKITLPANLFTESKILKERLLSFDDKVFSAVQNLDFDEFAAINQTPELFAAYSQAKIKYAQWGEKIPIDLLVRLLIERLKAFNQNDEIYYDQALTKLDLITSNQLKFLTLHHASFGLLTFLLNQDPAYLPNISNLTNYLLEDFTITTIDLDHLISLGLLNDQSPYKFPEIIISERANSIIQSLKSLIDSRILNLKSINIGSYNMSPVCKIISSLNIRELVKPSDIGFIYPERQLADFYVKNLIATADVTAFGSEETK